MIGEVFGKLTVIKPSKSNTSTRYWVAECDCGTQIRVSETCLKSGQKSCKKCVDAFRTNGFNNSYFGKTDRTTPYAQYL